MSLWVLARCRRDTGDSGEPIEIGRLTAVKEVSQILFLRSLLARDLLAIGAEQLMRPRTNTVRNTLQQYA